MSQNTAHEKISSLPPERDFIYDTDGFAKWCVESQGKCQSTVQSYLSSIRTVFTTQFDLNIDDPFLNLKRAFSDLKRSGGSEASFKSLEFEFKSLQGYKEGIEEYGDIIITEDGDILDAPKELWLAALRSYLKYIRFKIDRARQLFGLQLEISDDKELFFDLPLSKGFRQYLRLRGKGYTKTSIDSICCKLRRVYNLFIRRRLKVDVMPDLGKYISEGHSLKIFLELLGSTLDYEKEGNLAPELTAEDFSRGKAAFAQYKDFIEDYSANPNKYQS